MDRILILPARAASPEAVPLIRRGGEQTPEWYAEQARLWDAEVKRRPGEARAWRHLYLATEYGFRRSEVEPPEQWDILDAILDRMEKEVPDSWLVPYLRARRVDLEDFAELAAGWLE